jgi:prepilin peptidase CpaA
MMIGMVVLVVAVGAYVAMAACSDFRIHRIPNYITVPTAVLGLAYHTLAPTGMGPWMSLGGLAIGFGLLFLPWLFGGSGMGDVKLLAGLGAWLGPKWLLVAFALSMVIASALALAILILGMQKRGISRTINKRSGAFEGSRERGEAKKPGRRILPFAIPVAMGTWIVLAWLVCKGTM